MKHLAVLLALMLTGSVMAKDKVFSTGSTDGVVTQVEQGDYVHLDVKDAKGNEQSFFVLHPDKTLQDAVTHPAAYKGRKVHVTWQEVETNIPEAGGKQRVKEAVGMSTLK